MRKKTQFTSNYSNTDIQMYDISAKRSKNHGGANHDPSSHNHRSAAIAVHQDTADRTCTQERNISLFFGSRSEEQNLPDKIRSWDMLLGNMPIFFNTSVNT